MTTTTLSSSPNPSTYGQAVTFTAVVTPSRGAPPDGKSVTFMKGKTELGTGALSGGSARFTTSRRPAGNNPIKAVYGGDANFDGSKKAVTPGGQRKPRVRPLDSLGFLTESVDLVAQSSCPDEGELQAGGGEGTDGGRKRSRRS